MKLKNKKTGHVVEVELVARDANGYLNEYREAITDEGEAITLERLSENWEDYEEPDEYWYITCNGLVVSAARDNSWEHEKEIGNCFETEEEAKEAVEKLKAWKRLRDVGFKFERWEKDYGLRIILTGTIADEAAPALDVMEALKIITKEKEEK